MLYINLQGQQTVVSIQTHEGKKFKLQYASTHSVAGIRSVKGLY